MGIANYSFPLNTLFSGFTYSLPTTYPSPSPTTSPVPVFQILDFPWLSPGPSAFLTSYHLPTWSHLIPWLHVPSVWHQLPAWHIPLDVSKAFQLWCPHLLLSQWPRPHTQNLLRPRCSGQGRDWHFPQSPLLMRFFTECTDNMRSLNSVHCSHPHRHYLVQAPITSGPSTARIF